MCSTPIPIYTYIYICVGLPLRISCREVPVKVGVRDLPLRDMISLVRGGWGLDALGKFFRRRRRRRPPGLGKWALIGFRYEIGASGVRGSIRLVFRVRRTEYDEKLS